VYTRKPYRDMLAYSSAVKKSSNKKIINTVKDTQAITELKRLPMPLIGIL